MPTYKVDNNTKQLSADSYVRVSREYECSCGAKFTVTTDWPEGLTVNGAVNFNNVNCNQCGEPVRLPNGHHYVENYRLLTK